MNAVDLLKQDHRVVEELFKQVEDTPPSKHLPIFTKIKGELDAHAHIEETIFYPVLKKQGKKDLVDIVLEGIEEHVQIKMFLKGIAALSAKAERFEPKLKVLIEDTRHHVKEEEHEMFPKVKDQLTAEALEKLGARMETAKAKYQKARGIKPVKPSSGMLETIIDKAKGLMTGSPDPKLGSKNGKPAKAGNGTRSASASSTARNGEGRTVRETASTRASTVDKASAKMRARAEK